MDSMVDMFFLPHFFMGDFLEKAKYTRDGHIELVPKQSYGEGFFLLKSVGKSIAVNTANINFLQPMDRIVKDQPECSFISLCRGTMQGIGGAHIRKDEIYHPHWEIGARYSVVKVMFLPEFFDTFLNSFHAISPDELVQAFDALRDFPLIPDAVVILKQIGEASFTGDIGNLWIEAKTLELVAVVLDWYRRRKIMVQPNLRENDQAGIAEAIAYAAEHCSGPLTLEVLAKQAAMSISKFTAAFKIHTGLSAASYIRRIRMDKAMDLLKNTSAPLGDIAGMVGYKHQSRFFHLFREQFGVAPGAFRKRDDKGAIKPL
jgi:AraC-like DNA-binding protein